MGRKCCVPACKSNYNNTPYVPSFSFPKDDDKRALWLKSIHRADFIPSSTAIICVKHFNERFIIREDRVTRNDGSELVVPRKKLALTPDAYPSIFENQPSYMSTDPPVKRKTPEERQKNVLLRDEENFSSWCANDVILSFGHLKNRFISQIESEWLHFVNDEFILLYRIDMCKCPKIVVSIKIFDNLTTSVWHLENSIHPKSLEWILGPENKCDKWTKFDCLLNLLKGYKSEALSFDEKISAAASYLNESFQDVDDDEHNMKLNTQLEFLKEQVMLLNLKQIRYSANTLMWSAKLFFSYPAAYMLVRNSNVLTLPHPCYLKKLSRSLDSCELGNINSHVTYLKKKANVLNDKDKIVNVLLDEIYVTACLSYKAGQLVGTADNSTNEEATTIQCFMITSIFSKIEDVVALIPVKNLTSVILYDYAYKIIKILSDCGYTILSFISDNNSVNRNMFSLMCGGELKSWINHPIIPNKTFFFMFDTVHLIKSVRNNWLNQKFTSQTFYYPSIEDFKKVDFAKIEDLKKIYEKEKHIPVKMAPKLSQKVLYPTSTERQNVNHALNLFHHTNSVALQIHCDTFGDKANGTKKFIDHMLNWWKVVNVKHPQKGLHLRDTFCEPVTHNLHANMIFLFKFSDWVSAWNDLSKLSRDEAEKLKIPKKGGKLSRETQFALKFTTDTLIEVTKYLFETEKPSYVLLGKFQTDSIEARFGQYRQMSGGNYNISCRQVFESEHKLKVLELISFYSYKVGEFKIKFLDSKSDEEKDSSHVIPEDFYQVLNTNDDYDITASTISVIIYISGYVAFKFNQNLNCKLCTLKLIQEKKLELECPEDEFFRYLHLMDRGGLCWPQKFTVDIVTHTFMIFQKLISEKYEENFLKYGKQRNLIVHLTIEKLELLSVITNKNCECGRNLMYLAEKCIFISANIFLNNYSKIRNDHENRSSCKRKLSTLLSK